MNRTNLSIAILSATAGFMLAAHVFLPGTARADVAVKDRDYQVVTARVQAGGEGLYILDNRTGQLAVFTYDPASRGVTARNVRAISDAFNVHR
jgi:hypothetical protein